MPLRFGVQPPPTIENPSVRIFSLRPGNKALARLLEPVTGILVHWTADGSRPCREDECAHCGTYPRRWKGYAPCEVWGVCPQGARDGWHRWIIEVTEHAYSELQRLEPGTVFEVSRPGKRTNGPVCIRPDGRKVKQEPGATFDIRPHLLRLWGLLNDPTSAFSIDGTKQEVATLPLVSAKHRKAVQQ
jgi:hypothetical protein